MFTQILKNIKSIFPINEIEEEAFKNILELQQYKKGDFLFKERQICDKLFFINKGCARLFYTADNMENTIQFFFEDIFYTDLRNFLTNMPANENVQVIEDSEVIQIDKNNLYQLYESHPIFNRIGRAVAENAILCQSQLIQMLANERPVQRYLNLFKRRPDIVERIPQYLVASYLGIKPESLSRIRKKIISANKFPNVSQFS